MNVPRARRAAAALLVSSLMVAGCSKGDDTSASPSAPFSVRTLGLAAEPAVLIPEFVRGGNCAGSSSFRTHLNLIVSGGRNDVLGGVNFEFADGLGRRVLPVVLPPATPGASIPLPGAGSIQLPSGPPMPLPGFSSYAGLVLNGSRTLPLLLEFGCGVHPAGTLFIAVETTDERGRTGTLRTQARMGR